MYHFDSNRTPPQSLHLEITVECNLKCKQCHMWMLKESKNCLSTDEKLDLVHQFQLLNPKGIVVLTGGETMTKMEEFFAITSLCRSLGLVVVANSNTTYITDDILERLLLKGPTIFVISLDSHLEEIHDFLRGVKGNYQHVTATIKKLTALKRERFPGANTQVLTNSVIFDRNIELWEEYVEFARNELGVDAVLFQMLGKTFRNQNPKGDTFFGKHFVKDIPAAQDIIERISQKYEHDRFFNISKNDLTWMQAYVENPDFIGEQVCGSHEQNIIVDENGDVQLCFYMRSDLTADKPLGNVRQHSLRELWTGEFATDVRSMMSRCQMNCGMLSCHRKRPEVSKNA